MKKSTEQQIITREEIAAGILRSGEMNAKRFAEHIDVAHGTIKRWLWEGMPANRTKSGATWITPEKAKAWIAARFGKRGTCAIGRRRFIIFAQSEHGPIKIGWSSDIVRRIHELRRDSGFAVELLASFPGEKADALALHSRFASALVGDEWYRPTTELLGLIAGLRKAVAA